MADREAPVYTEWPHSPSHLFMPGGAYMITAGTYQKAPLFDSPEKRDFLMYCLFDEAKRLGSSLQAWAVMANHYHIVVLAPAEAADLRRMIGTLHTRTATWLNRKEGCPGRRVWFQYWDTHLTFQRSYLARLNYVHHNPAKHGLAGDAMNYRWCSLGWFNRCAEAGFRRMVLSFKHDRIAIEDDY